MTEWHMVSCEYPPQIGGVSSYVAIIAAELGASGHDVHVWCPPAAGSRPEAAGVTVHDALGRFTPSDLRRADRLLDSFPSPRRLLIQWVPHGYGYRSMNVPFCFWAQRRARRGDVVDLMVHEPYLAFGGSWKQRAAAAVHRAMTMVMLRAARRVWISTPAWRTALEPFAPARPLGFDWLPVPSPVEVVDDPQGVAAIRNRYAPNGEQIVGHFGMYSRLTAAPLSGVLSRVLTRQLKTVALLIGKGSERVREDTIGRSPELAGRIFAAGVQSSEELSRSLQACDVVVQPYPEGVTARRTTTMAALAHGRAIVTTDGPATEPLWRERTPVSLVPSGDLDAMAAEIERLLLDAPARAMLACRARALYEERFAVRHAIAALSAN